MNRRLITLFSGIALVGLASTANAALITFDDLVSGQVVGTQQGATFTTPDGDGEVRVYSDCCSHTDPNSIAPHPGSDFNFNGPMDVTFATAVNNLSFWIGGDNDPGIVGRVDVFGMSGFIGSFFMMADGDGGGLTEEQQNLSAFLNVTAIQIRDVTDNAGLVYDTFSFDSDVAAIPEPATLSLFGLGLAGLAMRRRKKGITA